MYKWMVDLQIWDEWSTYRFKLVDVPRMMVDITMNGNWWTGTWRYGGHPESQPFHTFPYTYINLSHTCMERILLLGEKSRFYWPKPVTLSCIFMKLMSLPAVSALSDSIKRYSGSGAHFTAAPNTPGLYSSTDPGSQGTHPACTHRCFSLYRPSVLFNMILSV